MGVFFANAVGLDQRVVNLILFYFPRDLQVKKFFSDLFFLPHPTLSPPHPIPVLSQRLIYPYFLSYSSSWVRTKGFLRGGGKESRHVIRITAVPYFTAVFQHTKVPFC